MIKKLLISLGLAALLVSHQIYAKTKSVADSVIKQEDSGIDITHVWARQSNSTPNSAIYMSIKNNSSEDVELIGVSAPSVANRTEIHQTVQEAGGIMKMVHINQLTIPAGREVEMKPHGLHVMLMGLKKNLEVGNKFTISLFFKNHAPHNIEVIVSDNKISGTK